MHESVISISSLIEICETKAIASGFKKGHQRTLEPYQNSRIECLARSIFVYVLTGRVDVRTPKKLSLRRRERKLFCQNINYFRFRLVIMVHKFTLP